MTEGEEQKEIIAWFRREYPEYRRSIRVSLSGLNFGSGSRAARMVNSIKSQGMELGESDLLIALPRGNYGSLVIEHKGADQKHGVSESQQIYLDYHNKIGNLATHTRGVEAAKEVITSYMSLPLAKDAIIFVVD